MKRKTVRFAQNSSTDEFEKVTEKMYKKILDGHTIKYVNNIVNVHFGNNDTVLTMYDIEIQNVCGNVIGCLVKLFKELGLDV